MIWLIVGFVMGLKFMYFDKNYEETIEEALNELKEKEDENAFEIFQKLFTNKISVLVMFSLAGFIPFVLDVYSTFFDK